MSRVQLKRRKRRERGNVSVRSLLCAGIGAAGLLVIFTGTYQVVAGRLSRTMTGITMLFFVLSLAAVCFGIRFFKREGYSASSRWAGVILPVAALAGNVILYVTGLLKVLQ